jgi:predicted amidohydrolase YtcJ
MPPFDLLLHNGKVVTLDPKGTIADAVGVRGGRIQGVGAGGDLLRDAGPGTRLIDLSGRTVLPGFFDAHPHMDREGLKARGGVPIAGLRSVGELVDAVARAVKDAQPGEWIVLMPMGDPPNDYVSRPDQLKDGRFPTRYDLDPVSPANPVYIRAVWGWWSSPPFPSVANSLALREAGITRDAPAPYNVDILKDRHGEPTGVFLERNRAPLLEYTCFRTVPRFTHADRVASVRLGSTLYSAAGTTSAYEGHGLTPAILRAYREVREAGALTVRMYAPVSVPSAAKSDVELADLLSHWAAVAGGRGMGDDYFRVGGVTLDLADPSAAAIIAQGYPYEQWAGHFHQGLSEDRYVRLGAHAVRLGLRLNTLICYDLERALRLFEAVDREVPIRERRSVGIHLLQATDAQLRRIRALGLAVTMTPNLLWEHAHAFGIDGLGDAALPIRRALDAGIPVALSTDNVPYRMLWTVWEALARWNRPTKRRIGESRLTREEVLRLAVQAGHYLTWDEGRRGSIEAGTVADLVVLDDDPLTCELDRIREISVDLTLVDGRVVHQRGP